MTKARKFLITVIRSHNDVSQFLIMRSCVITIVESLLAVDWSIRVSRSRIFLGFSSNSRAIVTLREVFLIYCETITRDSANILELSLAWAVPNCLNLFNGFQVSVSTRFLILEAKSLSNLNAQRFGTSEAGIRRQHERKINFALRFYSKRSLKVLLVCLSRRWMNQKFHKRFHLAEYSIQLKQKRLFKISIGTNPK